MQSLDRRPIFPMTISDETARLFRTALPEDGLADAALNDLGAVIDRSRVQSFFRYILGSAEP